MNTTEVFQKKIKELVYEDDRIKNLQKIAGIFGNGDYLRIVFYNEANEVRLSLPYDKTVIIVLDKSIVEYDTDDVLKLIVKAYREYLEQFMSLETLALKIIDLKEKIK